MWPFRRTHVHELFRLVRLRNPRRDVWECNCGNRYVEVFTDKGSYFDHSLQQTSLDNALLDKNNCTLGGSRLL